MVKIIKLLEWLVNFLDLKIFVYVFYIFFVLVSNKIACAEIIIGDDFTAMNIQTSDGNAEYKSSDLPKFLQSVFESYGSMAANFKIRNLNGQQHNEGTVRYFSYPGSTNELKSIIQGATKDDAEPIDFINFLNFLNMAKTQIFGKDLEELETYQSRIKKRLVCDERVDENNFNMYSNMFHENFDSKNYFIRMGSFSLLHRVKVLCLCKSITKKILS